MADRFTVRFRGLVDAREAQRLQDELERTTDLTFEPRHIEDKNALTPMSELVLTCVVTGVATAATTATIEGLREAVRRLMANWPGNARDADIEVEPDVAPAGGEGEPGGAPRED